MLKIDPTALKIQLAEKCGLVFWGYDDDGEPEFVGRREAWNKFEEELNKEPGEEIL